jgi:uncharacterized phage protein gp47/JayE
MALDDLPGTLEVPTRDAIATNFRRDYGIVSPASDTSDGTQPDVLAKTVAITLLPIYSDAVLVANGINEDAATGTRLDRVGARYGVPRPQAVGASGYVSVTASVGGGTIQLGDELKNRQTGKRYTAAETKSLSNGGLIRVVGADTGPATNLAAGVTLQWSSPRPGIGQTATVGVGGLTGGADVAQDAAYLAIIREARRNPANADNDAAIRACVMSTPGLAIDAVFTYPCVFGPGTHAFCFTLAVPAGSDPSSRIPNAAQVTTALAWLTGQMPGDDSYFALAIIGNPIDFPLRLIWDQSASGWTDATPWPTYQARGLGAGFGGAIVVSFGFSLTSFQLSTDNGDYTGIAQPQAGQTIAFWNKNLLTFSRKLIAAVSGTGPWTITTDTSVSDLTYSPFVGQRTFPWADSLVDLAKPVLAYFGAMGPGEMFSAAAMSNDGRRQRRNPKPPKNNPQAVGTDAIVPLLALSSIQSVTVLENLGTLPSLGTPGVSVYLTTLRDISAFP